MFNRFFLALILISILSSCEKKAEVSVAFYNVDSLLNAQVTWLTELKTITTKVAELDGKKSDSIIKGMDSAAWKNELDIFGDIDFINKSINRDQYQLVQDVPDTKSNLSIKSVSTAKDLPVKYLRIYYHQNLKNVKRIEAHFQERNSLYSNSRFMTLEFQDIHERTTLTHYSVHGGQKMFMNDSVRYSIQGSITIAD